MSDEIITKFRCNLRLEALDLVGPELDHRACVEVDQVIVMLYGGCLEAGGGALEGMPVHHALLLQQDEPALRRCERARPFRGVDERG